MKVVFTVLLILLQSDSFTKFTYCVERSRGPFERQCVELNPAGKGQARMKRRGFDEIKVDVSLSAAARDRYLGIIAATNNLEGSVESYEAGLKNVADLGKKHLTLEMPSESPREKIFNYSVRKEVIDLGSFFDGIFNEEMISLEIDNAIQFDKLAIPKQLERVEADLKNNRIADPERLIPILDKIQADARLINYARARAVKMKEQILAKKVPR